MLTQINIEKDLLWGTLSQITNFYDKSLSATSPSHMWCMLPYMHHMCMYLAHALRPPPPPCMDMWLEFCISREENHFDDDRDPSFVSPQLPIETNFQFQNVIILYDPKCFPKPPFK